MYKPKKILFAPLDWGLGHASRCIPLIHKCLELGHEVIVAGNEQTNSLIRQEFTSLKCIYIDGYDVRYSRNKKWLPLKMLQQIPKIYTAIKKENEWLKRIINEEGIDMVFSDNRYGLYHDTIPCYFITHQVQIQIPQSKILQGIANKINHNYIRRFKACLIPDYPSDSMGGILSTTDSLTVVHYLGNLSRFSERKNSHFKYELLLLLSGPEPQRSILENLFLELISSLTSSVLLVRGLPLDKDHLQVPNHIQVENYLSAEALENAILSSKHIICRSGYSTVMDMIKLNRHAILIPTPGQTEQEYLASYLSSKQWFSTIDQEKLRHISLNELISKQTYSDFPNWDKNLYESVIEGLVGR